MNGHIQVGQQSGVQIIRLLGEVRLTLCPAFERYITDVLEHADCENVLIDLSDIDMIDSSALGQLARIAMVSQRRWHIKPTIYTPDPSTTRLLESMGFDEVFYLLQETCQNSARFSEWVADSMSEEEARQQVISAHKVLMSLNESNYQTFCNLVESLESCQPETSADTNERYQ